MSQQHRCRGARRRRAHRTQTRPEEPSSATAGDRRFDRHGLVPRLRQGDQPDRPVDRVRVHDHRGLRVPDHAGTGRTAAVEPALQDVRRHRQRPDRSLGWVFRVVDVLVLLGGRLCRGHHRDDRVCEVLRPESAHLGARAVDCGRSDGAQLAAGEILRGDRILVRHDQNRRDPEPHRRGCGADRQRLPKPRPA